MFLVDNCLKDWYYCYFVWVRKGFQYPVLMPSHVKLNRYLSSVDNNFEDIFPWVAGISSHDEAFFFFWVQAYTNLFTDIFHKLLHLLISLHEPYFASLGKWNFVLLTFGSFVKHALSWTCLYFYYYFFFNK